MALNIEILVNLRSHIFESDGETDSYVVKTGLELPLYVHLQVEYWQVYVN